VRLRASVVPDDVREGEPVSQPGAGPSGPTPPGWYPDQWGQNRWWDGARWTDYVAPPATGPGVPPATSTSRSSTGLVVGLVVGGAVLVLLSVAVVVGLVRSTPQRAAGATPSSTAAPVSPGSSAGGQPVVPVTAADQGTVVFSDDFTQAGSGWTTKTLASGTTFRYGANGYVVVAQGDLHHYAYAPYDKPIRQLSASGTYITDAALPGQSGAGVTCDARAGARSVFFEFLVLPGRTWLIEEGHGAIGGESTIDVLKQGTSPVKAGATMTVTGSCATSPDGSSTDLTMFIDGRLVARVTSTTPLPAGVDGWQSDLLVSSYGTSSTTVVATKYVLRDTAA
jgi:hypothetical protein